jgi:hypothetical protein
LYNNAFGEAPPAFARAKEVCAMKMVRLIYTSRFSFGVGPNDIQAILAVSRVNNESKGVTGVLCYDPRFFLQCIEGPRDAVNELYRNIVADPRHENVTLLEYADIDERVFENWAMAYVRADALTQSITLKYSAGKAFDPFAMSAKQALGLMERISRERQRFLESLPKV